MEVPWLTLLLTVTFAAAVATLAVGRYVSDERTGHVAFALSLAPLLLSIYIWLMEFTADGNALLGADNAALQESYSWFTFAGYEVQYYVGVDGISMPLVVLTTLLASAAIMSAWPSITSHRKEFYSLVLFLEAALIGVFVALDLFLFFVFWEAVLIPMYFLIAVWGGSDRRYAAMKFLIYTNPAFLVVFVSATALIFSADVNTLSIVDLTAAVHDDALTGYFGLTPEQLKLAAFAGLFIGFAVKVPVVPFHTWLPDAHVEAPSPVSVLLAGVLLKMGTYGLLRFNFTVLPEAAAAVAGLVAAVGVVSVIYGALLAMAQTDLKRIVAYSSISSMGYVLLGLAAYTYYSVGGATFQMISHGLISGLMFMVVGVVYHETHHRDVRELSGLWRQTPVAAFIFLAAAFAYMGLPGMSGFAAEAFVFIGSAASTTIPYAPLVTMTAMFGIVLVAGYLLFALQKTLFGELRIGEHQTAADGGSLDVSDVSLAQAVPLFALLAAIVLLGVQPDVVYDVIADGTAGVVDLVTGGDG